jgi:hypothetical protein
MKRSFFIFGGIWLLFITLAISPVLAATDTDNVVPSDEEISIQAIEGRYEGKETIQGDTSKTKYLIAIEIGTGKISRPVAVYLQLGGVLPPTPQYSGNGFFLGPIGTFESGTSQFSMLILGNTMITKSERYNVTGAPYTTTGVLKKVE